MKGVYKRRPIWQPTKLSRLIRFLKSLLRLVTPKRLILAVLVLPLLLYIYREVTHDSLIIEPFGVPKHFEEIGLTQEIFAKRVSDALQRIETNVRIEPNAQRDTRRDDPRLLRDETSQPDVEIPGTKMGVKALVELIRAVFAVYPRHASGDIVSLDAPPAPGGSDRMCFKPNSWAKAVPATSSKVNSRVKVTVYITRGRTRTQPTSCIANSDDVDTLAQAAAEMILEQANPYILADYKFGQRDTQQTIALVESILENPSESQAHKAAALTLWGNVKAHEHDFPGAEAKYKEAADRDSNYAPAYNDWALALCHRGKYDDAISMFQKAVDVEKNYASAYNNWGLALDAQDKYDDAVQKYEKAIRINPEFSAVYNNLGLTFYHQKKYDEAVGSFKKALEIDPCWAGALGNLGLVLAAQKKYDDAIEQYKKATACDPSDANPYDNWGDALRDQKKYDEAIKQYEKAVELDAQLISANSSLLLLLCEQKKSDKALAQYHRAIKADPTNADDYKRIWEKCSEVGSQPSLNPLSLLQSGPFQRRGGQL